MRPASTAWETDPATIRAVVGRWVAVQAAVADDPALGGLPSRRPAELLPWLADVVERRRPGDPAAQRLIDALPGQVDALDAAGLPTTFVHGDFHPGNWRSDGVGQMILDWGDCYVGHPAADIQRLAEWLPPPQREIAVRAWVDAWHRHRPRSDPRQALGPMRVLGQVTSAIVYQRFLDNIEPDEQIYHENDPLTEIRDAISALNEA
jgi:Ser/Thr protein kinase RdoA (MazF antagonist)